LLPVSSPIFQGTSQLVWNSTSLDALKQCSRKYQLAILQGWSTGAENIDITFGLAYHKAVEVYHFAKAKGATHQQATIVAIRQAMVMTWPDILIGYDTRTRAKSRPNLVRSIVWYLEQFGEADPIETLILSNGDPAVEVTFAIELDIPSPSGDNYKLAGHLDRIGTYMGDGYFTDLKTTGAALGEYYFENFSPHNQMSLYSFAGKVHTDIPLKGGIIDAVQVQVGGSRYQRGFVLRTPAQLDEWYEDLKYWLAVAELNVSRNYWPMNDTACRMCNFKRICAMDPKVRPTFLASNFSKRIINPLEIRT
jgi:hypothetical protein